MTAIAIIGGMLVSFGVNRLLSSLLFNVARADPTVMAVAVLMLASVAFFASYLPARRASGADPMVALRCE